MKKKYMNVFFILTLLVLALPAMGEDCVMHIRTVSGTTLDVKVNETTQAGVYGNLPGYPAMVFYASTGQITTGEDGCPVPVVEDGVAQGTILCEMLLSAIYEINFSGLSAVNEVAADCSGISITDGVMRIVSVTEPVLVTVTDISGIIMYSNTISADTEINLTRYGKGLRIITVGGITFKIHVI